MLQGRAKELSHPKQQLQPWANHQVEEATGEQHQRVADQAITPLRRGGQTQKLLNSQQRGRAPVDLPIAVVLVVKRMAPGPGELRDGIQATQGKARDPIAERRRPQRVVTAVVHQREAAGRKQHQCEQHRNHEPTQSRLSSKDRDGCPEQRDGHQRHRQLPQSPGITGLPERSEGKIAAT